MTHPASIKQILSLAKMATRADHAEFVLVDESRGCPKAIGSKDMTTLEVGTRLTSAPIRRSVSVVGPSAECGTISLSFLDAVADEERVDEVLRVAAALVEEQLDRELERVVLDELGTSLSRDHGELRLLQEQLTQQNSELEYRASTDGLTGLPNRETIHSQLSTRSRQAVELAVVVLDLDRFKAINDTHGHRTGDFVLQAVARRLQRCLEPGDFAGRLGGDEFVVILAGPISVSDAAARTSMILEALQGSYVVHDGVVLTLEASAGVAVVAPGQEPVKAIAAADELMYQHKRWRAASRS